MTDTSQKIPVTKDKTTKKVTKVSEEHPNGADITVTVEGNIAQKLEQHFGQKGIIDASEIKPYKGDKEALDAFWVNHRSQLTKKARRRVVKYLTKLD